MFDSKYLITNILADYLSDYGSFFWFMAQHLPIIKPEIKSEEPMKLIKTIVGTVALVTMLVAGSAKGASFSGGTFTATGSGGLSASATFSVSGTTLTIILANASTADVLAPNQVLTALFFDTTPDMLLTPVSAMLALGSTTYFGSTAPNVGGEWSYAHDISNAPGGTANQGTSSTGLGLFSPSGNFPGANLQGPVSVDGLQYGLTSAGDIMTTGNSAVTGGFALTKNSVILTLTMSTSPLNNISNVRFLYGTSLDGTLLTSKDTPPVPDGGSTLILLGSALAGVGLLRRKITLA